MMKRKRTKIGGKRKTGEIPTPIQAAVIAATDAATRLLSDLAGDMKVTPQVLTQWRTGTRIPSPENLVRLAESLDGQVRSLARSSEALRAMAEQLGTPAGRERLTRHPDPNQMTLF